ncbi:unnamed protein product [Clonostachys chloroleuca]|uniref:BTB domain-containing protein n=1 Tax=Clonostachys chloroleuca TaxID=1926264 RepID=A0AA35LT02_9HYPO|nr:unnamed protein product [Clonostachys chloroleuca]
MVFTSKAITSAVNYSLPTMAPPEGRRKSANPRRGAGKDPQMLDGTSLAITELHKSMSSLFDSGLYSDLTVICGEDKYLVHRAVVCPRSKFFEAACRHNFKEAITAEINLPEDDPVAIKIMMNHFYNLNYSDGSETTSETGSALAEAKKFSLLDHAKVYSLAEKYGVPSLKKLAMDKFERQARKDCDGKDLVDAAVEAYTGTVQDDRGLRDEVVRAITVHMDVLTHESFREAINGLDIGVDVVLHLQQQGRILNTDCRDRW